MCQIKIKYSMPNGEVLQQPYTVESFDGEDHNHWYCTLTNVNINTAVCYAFPKKRIVSWIDDRDENNKKVKKPIYERNPRPEFLEKLSIGHQERMSV